MSAGEDKSARSQRAISRNRNQAARRLAKLIEANWDRKGLSGRERDLIIHYDVVVGSIETRILELEKLLGTLRKWRRSL